MSFLIVSLSLVMVFLSLFLILLVLIQRGRGGGLAGAFSGMGGQSAFGTRAGDTFTRITIVVAVIWVLLAGFLGMLMRNDVAATKTGEKTRFSETEEARDAAKKAEEDAKKLEEKSKDSVDVKEVTNDELKTDEKAPAKEEAKSGDAPADAQKAKLRRPMHLLLRAKRKKPPLLMLRKPTLRRKKLQSQKLRLRLLRQMKLQKLTRLRPKKAKKHRRLRLPVTQLLPKLRRTDRSLVRLVI